MSNQRACQGGSDTACDYWVVVIGAQLEPDFEDCIFSNRRRSGGWNAVYVTQLSKLKGILIRCKGALRVHVRVNPREGTRLAEMANLLEGDHKAYASTG